MREENQRREENGKEEEDENEKEGGKEDPAKKLRSGGGLDERQWAVLEYTDAMTRAVAVPDPVFAELRRLFSEREVVEITATVAAYNCVSRFLVALDVGETSSKKIE